MICPILTIAYPSDPEAATCKQAGCAWWAPTGRCSVKPIPGNLMELLDLDLRQLKEKG